MAVPQVTSLEVQKSSHKIINEAGNDITPKSLIHHNYSILCEKNMTNLDGLIFKQRTHTTNLIQCSLKNGSSSFPLMKLMSLYTLHIDISDINDDGNSMYSADSSLRKTSSDGVLLCFHQPESCDSETNKEYSSFSHSMKKRVTLMESKTIFIFELLQLTQDSKDSRNSVMMKAKELHQDCKTKPEVMNSVTDAATQTFSILGKMRSTYLQESEVIHSNNLTSNWLMYDLCHDTSLSGKMSGALNKNILNRIIRVKEKQNQIKFLKFPKNLKMKEDPMVRLYKNPLFASAVNVMEQIICIKLYSRSQKCFRGLIKSNPFDLDSKIEYTLKHLWSSTHTNIKGIFINCIRWNYTNSNLLAVSYGQKSKEYSGHLLIWNMKNPFQPERFYKLNFVISDIDWSHRKPNQLATGCYNGTLKVIDITKRNLTILFIISQDSSFSLPRIWQIQWWHSDNYEHIYTSNGDGKIFCCRINDDFCVDEIMKISRMDDYKVEIEQKNYCSFRSFNMPVKNEPEAILLQRHPIFDDTYLVGSDEGRIYRCLTIYSSHCIHSFVAHDGPICSLEYSPFYPQIFLTSGADWCTQIWMENITTPLVTLSCQMSPVTAAAWSPTNSTVIATCIKNKICIWDIRQSTQNPKSITELKNSQQLVALHFTPTGNQIVVADARGFIHVYNSEDIPIMPFSQTEILLESIEKRILTEPNLLQQFQSFV